MQGLNAIDGANIIKKRLERERPTFGICIGMQILFALGEEHSAGKPHSGVGIWPGSISELAAPILPHMGWNGVEAAHESVLFAGVESESFYFVHSYAAKTAHGKLQTWTTYGERFLSAVEDAYVCATQFHPEKSGDAGLKLIKNWTRSL
jgi:glutamine amidotransferase